MHCWDLSLSAYLLHLDSRLVPKAEETNLNFVQLAYSWVPCVSKTCLIMWLPDVFSTSCTTSKDPTLTHFPNNEWKSQLLLLELSLRHWKQTVRRRCWNNSLCINSAWRLASNVAELGTLTLNMKRRSEEKVLQEKVGTPLNQRWPSCGLWAVFALASACLLSGPWLNCYKTFWVHTAKGWTVLLQVTYPKPVASDHPSLDNLSKTHASWKLKERSVSSFLLTLFNHIFMFISF